MRYAIISDIHSNLEALSSVMENIDSLDCKEIVCLGDIVGYNANPGECIAIIKKRGIRCLMGNHDSRVSEIEEPSGFNPSAKAAIYWTRKKLTGKNKGFLKKLPRRLLFEGEFSAIHGWIDSTDRYILSETDARHNFKIMKEEGLPSVTFFGHTHVRLAYVEEGNTLLMNSDERIKIEGGKRYLINPGAVGQPRDGDPRASFLVYDSGKKEITFFRTGYDIKKCAQKVLKAGLPPVLAKRLEYGW